MPSSQRPTVRARRIGNALRQLRDERNLTVRAVVRRTTRSAGWLSMIENGLQPLHPDDLEDLLNFYDLPDGPLRESLVHLAAQGRRNNWQRVREGRISAAALDLASLEQDSASISAYQPNVVPGLLQTPGYHRGLIQAGLNKASIEVEELIDFRQRRQSVLFGTSRPHYTAIVGESALHQVVLSADVMRGQLEQLVEGVSRRLVALRVLPYTAGSVLWLTGPMTLLSLRPPGRLTVAVTEQFNQTSFLEDEKEVGALEEIFGHLLASCMDEISSLELIRQIASGA